MLVVDTSVVIDRLRDRRTPQTQELDRRIAHEPVLLGELVLLEVLQGARDDEHALAIRHRLRMFEWCEMVDEDLVILAAGQYRALRQAGVTISSQVDLLIGSFCIQNGHELLHSDKDYDHLTRHLGLHVALVSALRH